MPEHSIFGVHDLLRIDETCVLRESRQVGNAPPDWVSAMLRAAPCVVVRRGRSKDGSVPVGVRGRTRDQRWATDCLVSAVRASASPWDLLGVPINQAAIRPIPALHALQHLKQRWAGIEWQWGPAGSVGFELFAGIQAATATSDLDIVMAAPQRLLLSTARHLCDDLHGLGCRVDVRLETPSGGILLAEYATGRDVLLRTNRGESLCTDPWSVRHTPDADSRMALR